MNRSARSLAGTSACRCRTTQSSRRFLRSVLPLGGSLALGLLTPGLGRAQVTITRGPYLQSASPTAMTVRWRTSIATGSRLYYGSPPANYTGSVLDTAAVTDHELRITGLTPATRYAYAVGTPTSILSPPDATYSFATAPVAGANVPVRVWIVGDSGLDNAQSHAVRDQFEAWSAGRPPDLWLMLGDNAYTAGTDSDYQTGCFNLFPRALRNWPLFPTRGNHDKLYSGPGNDYLDFFTLPAAGECGGVPSGSESYYSYDWGPVHFVCLDSEGSDVSLGGPMLQWLRQDLAAEHAAWAVCYWHHPPYSKGSHDSDTESQLIAMRTHVVPILDSAGVDVVFCGHSHGYERSYLINGHYGLSTTLTPAMVLGPGDGRIDGSGPYRKSHTGPYPFEGAVYTVAGSSAQVDPVSSMPCMVSSIAVMGSVVLDFSGSRLDARFLDLTGAVRDSFTIEKGAAATTAPPSAAALSLAAPRPNPAHGAVTMEIALARAGNASLDVLDAQGRRVARLLSGPQPAGSQQVEWRVAAARSRAAAGLYWAVLTAGGERRVRRIVMSP